MEKITEYDPATALITAEGIGYFLNDALATGDSACITSAIGAAIRAQGVEVVARKTGRAITELEALFRENGSPTLAETLSVLKSLNLRLVLLRTDNAEPSSCP